jgi:hypothetical protein
VRAVQSEQSIKEACDAAHAAPRRHAHQRAPIIGLGRIGAKSLRDKPHNRVAGLNAVVCENDVFYVRPVK